MRWMVAMLWMAAAGQTAVPSLWHGDTNNAYGSFAMNAAAVRAANGFYSPTAVDVTAVWLQFMAVTTGDTLRVAIYATDANGYPTGSPLGYVDYAVTTSDANQWRQFTFNPPISIAANTGYAVVMEFPAYVAGNFVIRRASQGRIIQGWTSLYYNGSSWSAYNAKSAMVIETTSGHLKPRYWLSEMREEYRLNGNSSPDERAVACTFDRAMVLRGAMHYGGTIVTGPAVLRIYRDSNVIAEVPARPNYSTYDTVFTPIPRILLEPNVEYVLAFRPTTTTNAQFLWWKLNYPTGYDTAATWLPEFASGMCRTIARTDDGAWSDLPTRLHGLAFVVEDLR